MITNKEDFWKKYKDLDKKYNEKKVIGIFSAPSIHPQLQKNLILNAKSEGFGINFEPCVDFAKFLAKTTRKDLIDRLVNH